VKRRQANAQGVMSYVLTLLKKKSQRCGATLSLVKDQFGGTIGRKKKAACLSVGGLFSYSATNEEVDEWLMIWWLFSCSHKCGLFHVCFMMKFASW
jgi:hypothetical protein